MLAFVYGNLDTKTEGFLFYNHSNFHQCDRPEVSTLSHSTSGLDHNIRKYKVCRFQSKPVEVDVIFLFCSSPKQEYLYF